MQEIFLYFPFKAREELSKFDSNSLEEIRIRNNRPIFLKIGQDEVRTGYTIHTEEILEILQKFVTILFIHIKIKFVMDILQ